MMFYLCTMCDNRYKDGCKHSSIFFKPCYLHRKKGLLDECYKCYNRWVCATDSDLLEFEYELSKERQRGRMARRSPAKRIYVGSNPTAASE